MMKQPDWSRGIQFDCPTGDTSCHGKQISVHTRELAPETQTRATELPLKLALEQMFCCATYYLARNRWWRRGSFAPGACYRSVLREQAPSCVPACWFEF